MWWISLAALLIGALLYFLYINGYMITQAKTALRFLTSIDGKRASFSFCNGYIRRIVRFKESRTYQFTFQPDLTKGNVTVEILNSNKECVLCLDNSNRCAGFAVEQKSRYYMVIRFESASGKYSLNWI